MPRVWGVIVKRLLLALCFFVFACSTLDVRVVDTGHLISVQVVGHTSVITTTEGVYRGMGAIEGEPGEKVTVIEYYDGRRELWLKGSKSYVVLRR